MNKIIEFFRNLFSKKEVETSPKEFFDAMRNSVNDITEEQINGIKEQSLALASDFVEIGQMNSANKIMFHRSKLDAEINGIKAGFNRFVYLDDID